jgi:hypothetical protein
MRWFEKFQAESDIHNFESTPENCCTIDRPTESCGTKYARERIEITEPVVFWNGDECSQRKERDLDQYQGLVERTPPWPETFLLRI